MQIVHNMLFNVEFVSQPNILLDWVLNISPKVIAYSHGATLST